MSALARVVPLILGASLLAHCGSDAAVSGLAEPIRVGGAQFKAGALPGREPLTAEQVVKGEEQEQPYPTSIEVPGTILSQDQVGFSVSGRATKDAYAVGLRIADYGSGYWLVPAGSPDPANNGELAWRARMDLGPSIGSGLRTLLVAGIDSDGNAGTQRSIEFCVRNPVEDNLNACLPTIEPPALVVSLGWSSSADLDLRVVDSDGFVIDNRNVHGDNKRVTGSLEHDANANCVAEGAPRENIVWSKRPRPGTYYVYVKLSAACGDAAVPFVVSTHTSEADGKEFRQVETYRTSGELLPLQADGHSGPGTFITELTVE